MSTTFNVAGPLLHVWGNVNVYAYEGVAFAENVAYSALLYWIAINGFVYFFHHDDDAAPGRARALQPRQPRSHPAPTSTRVENHRSNHLMTYPFTCWPLMAARLLALCCTSVFVLTGCGATQSTVNIMAASCAPAECPESTTVHG